MAKTPQFFVGLPASLAQREAGSTESRPNVQAQRNVRRSERPNVQAQKDVEKRAIFGWKEVTKVRASRSWDFHATKKWPLPPPRVFLQKSSELLENKRVEFLSSAKEFARV